MLYAGVKGYLTEIPTERIGEYQAKLLVFIRGSYTNVIDAIKTEKDISAKTEEGLKQALIEFNKVFLTK